MFARNFSNAVILFFAPVILYAQELPSTSTLSPSTTEMPILAVQSESGETEQDIVHAITSVNNIVVATFSAAAGYDDNVAQTGNHQISSPIYIVTSTIALKHTRPRWGWNFSYSPGIILVPHFVQRNEFDQSLGTGFRYQPTSRVSVHFRQDFLLTTDPFQQLGNNSLESSLNPLQFPNDVVALPQVRRNELLFSADLSYRTSRHTTVGLGGNFIRLHFSQLADSIAGASLINTQQLSGSAFVSHDLTSRQTAGIEYTHLAISAGQDHADTDRVLYFHKISLTSNSKIVFFAGPEYSRSRDDSSSGVSSSSARIPIQLNSISPDAGVIYTFLGRSTAIEASFSRTVSTGGGFASASRTDSLRAQVRRKITRAWTGDLDAAFNNSEALLPSTGTSVRSVLVGVGIDYNLGRYLWMRTSYERIHQTTDLPGVPLINTNLILMSVGHSFTWPLGR